MDNGTASECTFVVVLAADDYKCRPTDVETNRDSPDRVGVQCTIAQDECLVAGCR